MVVLVNHYSASASEIVSACLQDHQRAVVIGERTWGKGSVQNVIELESGKSALKLTTASYARPNGRNIHRFPDAKETDEWGVKPNDGMEVKLSPEEMLRFLEYRRRRDIVQARSSEKAKDANAEAKSEDDAAKAKPNDEQKTSKPATDSAANESEKKPAADAAPTGKATEGDDLVDDGVARGKNGSRFVDRQLQKAVEYLSSEMARAQ
jgi:carboxyl-terminal processing protease